jgi:cyclic pyranopterin phosphate synthase
MNALPQLAQPAPGAVDRRGRPLRDLRVSVIETCNFRCPYCMPAGITPEESALDRGRRLSFAQIETAVRGFVRLGVRKVRLTGGEPL